MADENLSPKIMKKCTSGGAANAVYGLGLIGAVVYYIQNAESFWMGALGLAKALVWPAMIVYELLKFLQM